ncbi:MAG: lysine 2,3-aminomutase, partial [Gammaproteobacteria bacterium]
MPIATPRKDFAPGSAIQPRSYRVFTRQHLDQIPQLKSLDRETRFAMEVVANVLPFRVNEYVVEDLIDWADVPNDPIFRLIFPQKEMLEPKAFDRLADALRNNSSRDDIARVVGSLRNDLNPHPAGQMDLNVPLMNGESL